MSLFNDLQKRGLIHQMTSDKIPVLLDGAPFSFYCGFDPTADSLHVGSLLPLITMKRLQNHGHKPILLMGKSTALIGDPSFKSQERKLLTPEVVDTNIKGISQNIKNLIDCEVVANDWFNSMSVLDFLRDVGKHISVNNMLSKDSVKTRLEDREQGISFTEFSYMLLQGEDFRVLFKNKNCILQIGGSDQWSNLLVGTSLIRKELNQEAFGLTLPLLLKSDGTKFGKSENGNVWLAEEKTSVFDFFQFFLNVADSDVIDLLKKMTFLSLSEIESLEQSLKNNPELRLAQKALAKEVTTLVHGEAKFKEALSQTEKLFAKKDYANSQGDVILPESEVVGKSLVDLLVVSGLSSSKTAARKDIQGGGIYLENIKQTDVTKLITQPDLNNSRLILRKGKSNYKVIQVKD